MDSHEQRTNSRKAGAGRTGVARWVEAEGAEETVEEAVVVEAMVVVGTAADEKAAEAVLVTGREHSAEEKAGAGTAGAEMDSVEARVDSVAGTGAQIPSGRSCIRQMQTQSRHGRCFRGFRPGSSRAGS